jgi:hypothetical protein
MPISNFVQASFLGGEWSPFAQGRSDLPTYRQAMAVCRNGIPLEEGAWCRRSGTRFATTTRGGVAGRAISFAFEQAAPYDMVFTDGFVEFIASSAQSSIITTPLPKDFRLVTTNDNHDVSNITTTNPAQITTTFNNTWSTGDQIQFLFATTLNAGFVPLLRNRRFTITVLSANTFSIADPLTGAGIDGSTLGWSATPTNTLIATRILAIVTPYTAGAWSAVRKVQAETQAVLLHPTIAPQSLNVNTLPTASAFGTFKLAAANFIDGPYLDPPTDGTILTPNLTSPSSGTLPSNQGWNLMTANGSKFLAAASSSTAAATSTDGVTWAAQTLPFAPVCMTSNGTIYVIIGSGTQAATSPDGVTWTSRTLSDSGTWGCVGWNGTVFCVGGSKTGVGPATLTSPDGITWTTHINGTIIAAGVAIAWNGTKFAMSVNAGGIGSTLESADGITWTIGSFQFSGGGFPPVAGCIAVKTTVFCALVNNSNISFASTDNGVTWLQGTMPSSASWVAIAANGTTFVALASGAGICATSTDGLNWTSHALPSMQSWDAIAWNGTTFSIAASGYTTTYVSTTGVFSTLTLTASATGPINNGVGFVSTDVGRLIRLLSEPLPWFSASTYSAGDKVKFNNVYFFSLQGTNTNHQPDVSPTFWAISTAIATWTWGTILTVNSSVQVIVSIGGADLLYPTIYMKIWRLGVYSNTTGWPTCGAYHEGRIWLAGALPNRFDASVTNQIAAGNLNFAPTAADGTVAGNNAISYVFNSDDVNPIFWMIGTSNGLVAGTLNGEWLIAAPTSGPITPTNIVGRRTTTYGAANVEPVSTQLTISFVQRFNRKLLEHFPDALSGRYTAPNLAVNAKHLTVPGISEIRYQQELSPIIWNRLTSNAIVGATYERESLFSSQPAKFVGWHRHDLGSARTVESIAVGPSIDGSLDSLAMVTNDGTTRHVEILQQIFDVNASITSGWLLDDAVTPSGGVITAAGVNSTLQFFGLWHLNGKKVTVSCGGVDVGDFTVSSGSVTVPIDHDVAGLFTSSYLVSISSATAYGAQGVPIDGPLGRLTVPAVVGFTYTSQGQILRPDAADQTRSQLGPGLAKPRRLHQFGALLAGTQRIFFGTSFGKLHEAQLKSPGGTQSLTLLQLFNGVYSSTVDDSWGTESMLCWQINRPYPACVVAVDGFLQTTDR